jgi:hypothetical protein
MFITLLLVLRNNNKYPIPVEGLGVYLEHLVCTPSVQCFLSYVMQSRLSIVTLGCPFSSPVFTMVCVCPALKHTLCTWSCFCYCL